MRRSDGNNLDNRKDYDVRRRQGRGRQDIDRRR